MISRTIGCCGGSPRDFLNVYKDTFDFLYRSEAPEMINLTVHAHFGGRPMMSAMLTEILRYLKGFSKVWVCAARRGGEVGTGAG